MPITIYYSILFSVYVTVSAAKVSVCRATYLQLVQKVLNGLHFRPKALSLIGHHHVLCRLFWICGKWEERIDFMRSSKQQKELTSSPEIPVIKLQGQVIILEMHIFDPPSTLHLVHLLPDTSQWWGDLEDFLLEPRVYTPLPGEMFTYQRWREITTLDFPSPSYHEVLQPLLLQWNEPLVVENPFLDLILFSNTTVM